MRPSTIDELLQAVEPPRLAPNALPTTHILDLIGRALETTPAGATSFAGSFPIRRTALEQRVPYFTTIAGAEAAAEGIDFLKRGGLTMRARRDYHRKKTAG